jgi:glutaredoxin
MFSLFRRKGDSAFEGAGPASDGAGPAVVVYTTKWCPGCQLAKHYLNSRGVAFQEIDIEKVPGAAEQVMKLAGGYRTVPTFVIGGSVVVDWSQRAVDAALAEAGLA